MDPVLLIRNHAFATFHDRICSVYSRLVPRRYRSSLEYGLLSCAVVFIAVWIHVHLTFFKLAGNCFDQLSLTTPPPPDHIVQVEMFWNSTTVWQTMTQAIHEQEDEKVADLLRSITEYAQDNVTSYDGDQVSGGGGNRGRDLTASVGSNALSEEHTPVEDNVVTGGGDVEERADLQEAPGLGSAAEEGPPPIRGYRGDKAILDQLDADRLLSIAPEYVLLEFSQKSGYLGLSKTDRERFNISSTVYSLDLNNATCFGGTFGQLLHYYCLGFETTLINSYRYLMDNDSSRAFVKNVLSGSYYYLKIAWLGRARYLVGVMPLVFFTMIASAFVRQSQYQLFKLLFVFRQMVMQEDMPFAMSAIGHMPLLTITYACVGLVVVMSEVLADSGLFCMTMLITVWIADQYYAIFCNTPTAKKYWPKFFYLYHFIPYAFYVRMNGIYWMFPFLAHWCLLQHSMLYFFHRYELPLYEANHPRAPTVIDLNGFGIHMVAFVQHNPVVGWLQYQLDRLAEEEDGEGDNGTEQEQPGEVVEVEGAGEQGGGGGGGGGMGAGMMNISSEADEDGEQEADHTSATTSAGIVQGSTAAREGDQQDLQWYTDTADLNGDEQDAADDSVERVSPHHHSSGWSQDSTTTSSNTIDFDHTTPPSLLRRSLH